MTKPADQRSERTSSAIPSSGDLAVAGAVPMTFGAIPALAEGGVPDAVMPHSAAIGGVSTVPSMARAAINPADDDVSTGGQIGALSAAAADTAAAPVGDTAPASPTQDAAPVSAPIVSFIPMPQGAGSSIPTAPVGTSDVPTVPTAQSGGGNNVAGGVSSLPSPIDAAELEAVRAQVSQLQETLEALTQRVPEVATPPDGSVGAIGETAIETARTGLDEASEAVAGLTDDISTIADQVTERAEDVLTAATDVVGSIADRVTNADALTDTVRSTAEAAVGAASTTVETLTGTVQDGVEALSEAADTTLEDITTASADALAGATATVDTTIGAATDTLGDTVEQATTVIQDLAGGVTGAIESGIGGTDPTAGITTLVGMVSAADAFGLHDTGGAGEALVPPLGAIGAVDVLADIAPVDALLGLGHHDGDGHALGDLDGLL